MAEKIIWFLLFMCSACGFGYGAKYYYRRHVPLFHQLIVSALGCMMLSRVYEFVIYMTAGSLPEGFCLAMMGDAGGFLFLASASFGQMDGLGDGREKKYRIYRFLPLAAPLLILAGTLRLLAVEALRAKVLPLSAICVIAMFSSYYNLKHLIFPDVDFGILKSIRGYNALALAGTFSYLCMVYSDVMGFRLLWMCSSVLTAVWYLLLIPVLKGGSRKWTV